MGLDINLNTSKIDMSEDDGLNVDLYEDNIDISDDEADDIIIEITGLKSISKFIGLEDTPLYYNNGKFFKVEDNKIVYTNIEWKDISGNLEDAPEIVALIEDLVEEISAKVVDDRIYLHNIAKDAHPYIQNIINENYVTLDTKIDDTKEELSQDISNLNDALNQEISDRETADNALSEDIQEEILARIEGDATLQGEIDTLNTDLQNEIDARIEGDTNLSDSLDELSNNLIQEVLDRQEQDGILQEQITSNYNTLDDKIDTEISNRTSADTTLQNNIDAEASTRQNADTTLQGNIDTLSDTVSSNYNDLSDQIDNLSDTVLDNYTDLDGKISDLTDTVNDNDTAINSRVDGINTTLTTSINNLSNTVTSNYTTLDTKIDNTKTSLEGDISDLSDTVNQNYTDLSNAITTSASTINSRIDSEVSTLNTAIGTETTSRQNADNNLQSQIDAIVSSSDVFDIVGTYAELQAYDISTVPVNDIIKVLVDSSHDNAATYYRCIETAGVKSWSYIGSEGAYYTKSESDTKFVDKTTTINNIPLSSNITLTASDVNALPNTTVIGDGVLTLQKNGVNIDTFNANATANKSINITVPTDTADLTNGAEFITASSLPTVNNGTLTIQANGITVGTFTANQAGNTTANIIVPDSATWGNITGTLSNQTDLQNALNNKYDASNPDGFISGITSSDVTTALGYTPYNASNPNGYINTSALNGYATENWVSNQNYVDSTTLATTLNNYVLSADLANVATTGDYDDLINKPTEVTESTVSGWGFTKNVGTVTSVNNILPDSNGNVSIPISGTPTWGEITGDITNQTDLQAELGNFVTLSTAQDISGRKTFLGEKAIYFKQSSTNNKLGFTLYNPSSAELGALEYRPNTINGDSLLALNCPKKTGGYVGFRYWGSPTVNIVAPKVATAGTYYIPTHFTDGTNTVTSDNTGIVNLTSLLPDLSSYQPLLVSGSNIKTINGASILGGGNLTLDGLPSQTGQNGKFLTTNGTEASWANTTKVIIRDWSVS